MQPRPVPLVEMESQHSTTLGASQDEVVAAGAGLGRAEAAMATERTARRVLGCIVGGLLGLGRVEA